jgi:hypothetical protein
LRRCDGVRCRGYRARGIARGNCYGLDCCSRRNSDWTHIGGGSRSWRTAVDGVVNRCARCSVRNCHRLRHRIRTGRWVEARCCCWRNRSSCYDGVRCRGYRARGIARGGCDGLYCCSRRNSDWACVRSGSRSWRTAVDGVVNCCARCSVRNCHRLRRRV